MQNSVEMDDLDAAEGVQVRVARTVRALEAAVSAIAGTNTIIREHLGVDEDCVFLVVYPSGDMLPVLRLEVTPEGFDVDETQRAVEAAFIGILSFFNAGGHNGKLH